jgi:flavin reductase (DIM6/NTAB) family NADH-FMN oxidoreductase RutF
VAGADVASALTDRVDQAMFVITAANGDGEHSGCLAGFVTQCSIDPTRFLVCVSRVNHTFGVVQSASAIGLHLLGGDQAGLASLFGELTGDDVDKFAHCRWSPGRMGAPILAECAAWIEGSIDARFDAGDHQALLVAPVDGGPGPCAGTLVSQQARDFDPGHPVD